MQKKIAIYFIFVLLFIIERPIFMLYNLDFYSSYPLVEWLKVIWYGLPHDLTCAGYIMALPFLLSIVNVWFRGRWHDVFMKWYLRIILFPVLFIFFWDIELYAHWGFRIDCTALNYFLDNPWESVQYAPLWAIIVLPLFVVFIWWLLQKMLCAFYKDSYEEYDFTTLPFLSTLIWRTLAAILLCGILFLAIRGGVTTSTMNVGRVYYSQEMPLNHAATNPLFSFFKSLGKKTDFKKQYRFMKEEEVREVMEEMQKSVYIEDSVCAYVPLLNTERPDILMIILESICGSTCTAINPAADTLITPNISRLYGESIGFTNFYANSFRTDRGLVSILSGYPAQPNYSVMKNQYLCNRIAHLPKRLSEYGYSLRYIHGGDVEFTNMKGYLRAGNIMDIICDKDFPITDRLSKWGVPDGKMFEYTREQLLSASSDDRQPSFTILQTLSSHEPFDVPYHHLADPYTNSAAYSDSCLGAFIDEIKQTPVWENLLVIVLPDHCYSKYPATLQNHELAHFRIPVFWTGGAISEPCLVETLGSQIDLAATLLSQLDIPHDDFIFSKDMLDETQPHFAFYTFSDGFGFVTDSCRYIQDNLHNGFALSDSFDPEGKAEKFGKAYLQNLYDDLSKR